MGLSPADIRTAVMALLNFKRKPEAEPANADVEAFLGGGQ